MNKNEKFNYAIRHTKILKAPKQSLATFGGTVVRYYLISELMDKVNKVRIREGKVIAEKPKIVVPHYLLDVFEGWDKEVREYAERTFEEYGENIKGLGYKFKNDFEKEKVVSSTIADMFDKIKEEIESRGENLAVVIEGVDDNWQISLMKFIIELSMRSFPGNVTELEERGFFGQMGKDKKNISTEIEQLFKDVQENKTSIYQLGKKLRQYGSFKDYEDRFFSLFRKKA
ncbi:hypothetical protein KAU39_03270 [bacterium]|nr:hypothetical protein [bacterium]